MQKSLNKGFKLLKNNLVEEAEIISCSILKIPQLMFTNIADQYKPLLGKERLLLIIVYRL